MIQLINIFSDFCNSILALIVHDLKLTTTFDDFLMTRNRFMSDLYNWFNMFIEIIFFDQCYVDFDMNDWSQTLDTSEFVLFWKIACLHYWTFRFINDNNNRHLKLQKTIFLFFNTWNAASASVLLIHTNLIWIQKRLIYFKTYNVIKNLFFTSAKNVLSFANDMFEILTFISTEIEQWAMVNRWNVHFYIDSYHDFQFFSLYWFKSQTSKAYNAAKIHIAETLKNAIADQINYDVRQKYWMTLTTFMLLNLNHLTQCEHFQFFDSNEFINEFKTFSSFFMIQSLIGNLHWLYWCFFIKKIVEFMFTYINHYLLLIKILIVHILSISNCSIVFFEK